MGNYKDIKAFIASLVKREKPFLIIKYASVFLDRANNTYEVVTMSRGKLQYMSIDRRDALDVISQYNLPLLHSLDSRNMIWGKKEFNDKYKELCLTKTI